MAPNTPETRAALEALRLETADLNKHIDELITAQTRPLKQALAVLLAALLVVGFGAWYLNHKLHENLVTGCRSQNDRNEDARGLWDGLVLSSKPRNEGEQNWLDAVHSYTDDTYAERDCDRLEIPYVGPPDVGRPGQKDDFPLLQDYVHKKEAE